MVPYDSGANVVATATQDSSGTGTLLFTHAVLPGQSTADLARRLLMICDAGITIALIDHDMDLVFEVCQRVAVLDLGRLAAVGPAEEIRADERVIAAYLGDEPQRTEVAV